MILYRGVNPEFHAEHGGKLIPKDSGPFLKAPEFGVSEWDNCYWGTNEQNAVITHQLHQAGYATCGISFTPFFERAVFYATHDGRYKNGIVYEIETNNCTELGVSIYTVSEIVPSPSVPQDQEIILVAKAFGELPSELIVKIHKIET